MFCYSPLDWSFSDLEWQLNRVDVVVRDLLLNVIQYYRVLYAQRYVLL